MQKESTQYKNYSQNIHPARVEFMKSPGINYFMTETDPKKLLAFLIIWTASSIKMTEQVEHWIRRAGENCQNKNFNEVGERLKYHSKQEADHDKMLVQDIHFLITKWNEIYADNLTLTEVLAICNIPETQDYIDLHENVINSSHPYSQTAIEFEIERISVAYGPRMIENILHTLGEEFEEGVSFLAEHVLLDQGHTKFNIDLLEKCFTANADLNALTQTGKEALKIYAGFLSKCMNLSSKIIERATWKSNLTI